VTHAADPRVDAYIDALPDWQQAIRREVRDLVRAADHEVAETIKRTNRPVLRTTGHPRRDAVTVSVDDTRGGHRFDLAVARDRALEAFYHPFAYAA
jgi:hypothetical protein